MMPRIGWLVRPLWLWCLTDVVEHNTVLNVPPPRVDAICVRVCGENVGVVRIAPLRASP